MTPHSFPRRFFRIVDVVSVEDGFSVTLDGKTPRTPGGHALLLPTVALAEAVAREWDAQTPDIRPDRMPLSQLVNTAIDRVHSQPSVIVDQIVAYGGSDLLCYRAEMPRDLVARQAELWQPWLDWLRDHHGVELQVTRGIVPVHQDKQAMAALHRVIQRLDLWSLTALQAVVPGLGSLVLGLALVQGHLSADQAHHLSLLDEQFQAELWGLDEEAKLRHDILKRDLSAAVTLLQAVGLSVGDGLEPVSPSRRVAESPG